jgi:hypothetical protein
MNVEEVKAIETRAIRFLLERAIAEGYSITVNDGQEDVIVGSVDVAAIMDKMFSVDEETLILCRDGRQKTVLVIHGNGRDVFSDWSQSLDDFMNNNGVLDAIDEFDEYEEVRCPTCRIAKINGENMETRICPTCGQ